MNEGERSQVEPELVESEPLPPPTQLIPRGDRHPQNLFLVAVPGWVGFPDLVHPVPVQEDWALRSLEHAASQSDLVGFVVQREPHPHDSPPSAEALSSFGCLVRILRDMPMPDGRRTFLVQGIHRFRVERLLRNEPYLIAKVQYPPEVVDADAESLAMARNVRDLIERLVKLAPGTPGEMAVAATHIERQGALADFAANYFVSDFETRIELLAETDVKKRLLRVNEALIGELGTRELGQRIQDEIREKIEERQREFFLREQLKAIRRELGEDVDGTTLDADDFESRLEGRSLPEAAAKRVQEDLRRLRLLSSDSPEAAVVRNYLDWLLAVPWEVLHDDNLDLEAARATLDADHSGLDEIKQRIVEALAVRRRVPEKSGHILCFVGPPGVGKTSLGRSIADAMGRAFVRAALGGVHDEAEIRGHRRTYIGAMPGRIVRGLRSAGSMNPVFLLDELDKLGQDFRGDPSAALLEVLDPAQNHTFSDHYLEVPLDLSRVFFLATANEPERIPAPLYDRLEVLEIEGYVTAEKLDIATRHLLPKQLAEHGLARKELRVDRAALRRIIEEYTREAGVRGLEKMLARLCRRAVTRLTEDSAPVRVRAADLDETLGPPRYIPLARDETRIAGVALGLAWTPVGGEVLKVEARRVPFQREPIQVTGMLGEVMLESSRIALSFLASRAEDLGIEAERLKEMLAGEGGLHVHVPAGAVRKDGPSAGVTLATALLSLLRDRPVRRGLAMTGELTLTGGVLPVGGIRDKLLAAQRHGCRDVILPEGNRKDLAEIRPDLLKGLRCHFVEHYSQVLELAFGPARKRPAKARKKARKSR